MATIEETGLLTVKDDSGNQYLLYPVTKTEAVDGLDEALAAKINTTDIVDNLESTSIVLPLSANQGNVLNGNIQTVSSKVDELNSNLLPSEGEAAMNMYDMINALYNKNVVGASIKAALFRNCVFYFGNGGSSRFYLDQSTTIPEGYTHVIAYGFNSRGSSDTTCDCCCYVNGVEIDSYRTKVHNTAYQTYFYTDFDVNEYDVVNIKGIGNCFSGYAVIIPVKC